MNKVKVGFFSFTEITDPSEHRAYNEWHQLDHLPEQYPLAGVAYGERWVSTPACRAARLLDGEMLAPSHYMTLYLMTEPVKQTVDEFVDLGQRLFSEGRFHQQRAVHLSGPFQWVDAHVAPRVLIGAETVPYRPNTGIFVTVEEIPKEIDAEDYMAWVRRWHEGEAQAWCEVPGVMGSWTFATSPFLRGGFWTAGNRRITIHYLDDDPALVAGRVGDLLEARWEDAPVVPIHAGPLERVIPYQWDWFD